MSHVWKWVDLYYRPVTKTEGWITTKCLVHCPKKSRKKVKKSNEKLDKNQGKSQSQERNIEN